MLALLSFAFAILASPFKSKVHLEAENTAVCTENLNPQILMMKPTKDRV